MDLGLFRRSKTNLWTWILLPVLLVAVAHYAVAIYCRTVERSLARREALMKVIPRLDAAQAEAEDTVGAFSPPCAAEEEVSETLRSQLEQMADEAGLEIQSLSIKAADDKADALVELRAAITAEGSLRSTVRLLNQVQTGVRLLRLHSAKVHLRENRPGVNYGAELVLSYTVVTL